MANNNQDNSQKKQPQQGKVGEYEIVVEAPRLEEPAWAPSVEIEGESSYPIHVLQTLFNSDTYAVAKFPTYEDAKRKLYAAAIFSAFPSPFGSEKAKAIGKSYMSVGGKRAYKGKKKSLSGQMSYSAVFSTLLDLQSKWEKRGLPPQLAGAAAALEARGYSEDRIKKALDAAKSPDALLEAFGEYEAAARIKTTSPDEAIAKVLSPDAFKRLQWEYQAYRRGM